MMRATRRILASLVVAIAVVMIAYFRNGERRISEQPQRPSAASRSAPTPGTPASAPEQTATHSRSDAARRELSGVVTRVSDGDTLRVRLDDGEEVVRLIGVDAPEIRGPHRRPERGGDAAKRYVRSIAEHRRVRVTKDPESGTDPHGRTLAYVHLEDGTLLNREIIRAGHARVYRRFQFREREGFLAAEQEARRARRGIWARESPR